MDQVVSGVLFGKPRGISHFSTKPNSQPNSPDFTRDLAMHPHLRPFAKQQKQQHKTLSKAALLEELMDRKSRFDPRLFWHVASVMPWHPLYGFPPQTPFTVAPGWEQEPRQTFWPPASTSLQQTMSQESQADGWPSPHTTPPAQGSWDVRVDAAGNDNDPSVGSVAEHNSTRCYSHSTGVVPTAVVLQNWSRLLQDALQFFEECAQQHRTDVENLAYLDVDCRNKLWSSLMASRLKDSELHKHLFLNLALDVEGHVQQALRSAEAGMESESDDQNKYEKSQKAAHELRILGARSRRVTELHAGASASFNKFNAMVGEMTMMVEGMKILEGDDGDPPEG
ncbi:hypothetical protein M406DRAFT_70910 [Cryphonectria parasitica EP155]|uniref:Uncharacterized protein n=1 Tax=Cryphonectria parasitica (strain ATCC 38755 / EP155) TaxID=660469 RepID=A0A9P5CMM7_CRYP1|nr:uncharacterized protein M406DRAFT_70910 [Cryphonectria parasitica EP155]KAF3764554.1 hypothetical protein M406DRAFT_70910 [Cryphonectria parasitica EP155]